MNILLILGFLLSNPHPTEFGRVPNITTASLTYYVSKGITHGDTFPTIQSGINAFPVNIGHACTLKISAGTYTDTGYTAISQTSPDVLLKDENMIACINKNIVNGASFVLLGDTATPSNVLLRNTAINYGIGISSCTGIVKIQGIDCRKFKSFGAIVVTSLNSMIYKCTLDSNGLGGNNGGIYVWCSNACHVWNSSLLYNNAIGAYSDNSMLDLRYNIINNNLGDGISFVIGASGITYMNEISGNGANGITVAHNSFLLAILDSTKTASHNTVYGSSATTSGRIYKTTCVYQGTTGDNTADANSSNY
jgi:hypothetical protein